MKDRKVSHKVYGVWEYEKEIVDLNKMSQDGWQLEKGGCFHSVFIRNEKLRYIYQLDYAPGLDDKNRYLELFEEQGWIYINSTFNGWHYFKKEYHEDMTQEEQEIYSDRESLYEMQGRYVRIMTIFAVIYALFSMVYIIGGITSREPAIILEGVVFILMGAMFAVGLLNVKRKRNGERMLSFIPAVYIILIALLLLIVAAFLL